MDGEARNSKMSNNSIFIRGSDLSRSWLMLGIFALAVSGLLSLILVFARAPFLSSFLPDILPFKTALIVHVDLSVLVWLLSVTASIWCLYIKDSLKFYVQILAYLAWLGVILISISPFIPGSEPISNNYIPILQNFPFILGVSSFLCAVFCISVIVFVSAFFNYLQAKDDYCIVLTSSFIMIIAALCFVMSHMSLEIHRTKEIDAYYYYEMLFWGGGHILQFLYTQIAGFIWLVLFNNIFESKKRLKALYSFYFVINALFTAPAAVIYWFVHIDDPIYTEFFTLHMKYIGGIAPFLILATMIYEALSSIRALSFNRSLSSSLISSITVFFSGGILGMLISGVNVVIPAHYHGSIVGVSLAFMGYSYLYISKISVNNMASSARLAYLQPIIYGAGQVMHIIGLWIAGGYGALRKTPGLAISSQAKFGMAIMGIGGLIAIIGGLMFVIICVKNLWLNNNAKEKLPQA
ncbi:MAG: hypothetical protein K0Q51_618 [Rickettsiaceae bacterium]|jgi:hypothetical protein|nr:hypothetical protein [Rickettsiaceae bacterium]